LDQVPAKSARGAVEAFTGIDTHDPYLDALEYLAAHHGLPFSRADIRQSLPLHEGRLNATLFCRAAERIGLVAKVVARKPSRVSGIVCPFVVPLASGDVAIAVDKVGRGRTRIIIPGAAATEDIAPAPLDLQSTGHVIYVSPAERGTDAASARASNRRRGHWLWSIVARFWPSWLYVILAALFINLLGLALPLFVMNVYDRVVPNNSISTLWALAIGVGIALVFDFTLRMLRSVVIDSSSQRIDMRVSAALFEQAVDASMAARPQNAGEIASHVREFETVRDFFTSTSITSAIDLLFIGVFLGVLWLLVGPLVLVPALAVPIVLATTLLIQLPLGRAVRSAQKSATHRQGLLVESLVAVETVKAASVEGALQGKWEAAVAASVRSGSAIRLWSSFAMYFAMSVQQAVSVFILVWGVFLIAEGEITIGALVASNILAGRVLAPLSGIAMTIARAQQAFSALGQLNRLMRLERDHDDPVHDAGRITSGGIEFRELTFSYPGLNANAVDGLSLVIAPGERVGLIGRVGSGKSTLGKLLSGLYRPDSGAVLINGADIRHYKIAELRNAAVYAGQEAVLFSGTVRDSIMMANPRAAGDFEIAARVAGVAAFVQSHPQGYAMQVGERGRLLSGGQRQAVALARAMMGRPKILFLDEPTSAMDNLSEANFVRAFRGWLSNDTTLIVATHRTSLLSMVSRLIVMENGKVIADGPKDKVLALLKKGNLIGGDGPGAGDA